MTKRKHPIATREQLRPIPLVLEDAVAQQPAAELWAWLHVLMQAYEALWPAPGAAVILKRIGTARDVLAEELHKQRRVRSYFPNLVDLLHVLDLQVCFEMTGEIPPSPRALRIWTPRGPRRGSGVMSPEQFRELEASARADLRANNRGNEPSIADVCRSLGVSRPTYYRLKAGAK